MFSSWKARSRGRFRWKHLKVWQLEGWINLFGTGKKTSIAWGCLLHWSDWQVAGRSGGVNQATCKRQECDHQVLGGRDSAGLLQWWWVSLGLSSVSSSWVTLGKSVAYFSIEPQFPYLNAGIITGISKDGERTQINKYIRVHSGTYLLYRSYAWLRFWSRLFFHLIWLRPKGSEKHGSRTRSKRLWYHSFCFSLHLVFLAIQKCFHVSVGGQNLECLINPAINKSGEVTIGVTELQSKALHLAFLHANRLVEKPPVGKNIRMQKREAGWQEGCRTKTRVSRQVGWLFHSINRLFIEYFLCAWYCARNWNCTYGQGKASLKRLRLLWR